VKKTPSKKKAAAAAKKAPSKKKAARAKGRRTRT
jgi:hypothetical protein